MAGVLTRPLPRESEQKATIRPFPLLANRDLSFPTRRAVHVTVFPPYQASSSPGPASSCFLSASVSHSESTDPAAVLERLRLRLRLAMTQCISKFQSYLHTRNDETSTHRIPVKLVHSSLCTHARVAAYQSRAAPTKPSNPMRPKEPPVAPALFLVGKLPGATLVGVPEPAVVGPASRTMLGVPVA